MRARIVLFVIIQMFLLMAEIARGDTGQISQGSEQVFQGWGTSLAWEANLVYGNRYQTVLAADQAFADRFMDLLFGDPAEHVTLGLNAVRYNIGGGDDPTHNHMNAQHPGAQMEGFQDAYDGPFFWDRDQGQIKMLQASIDRGVNLIEAFSNSPPYWMTKSGCAAGSVKPGQDNLDPNMYQSFADYLARVALHFSQDLGIDFDSLEPFNEPDSNWWIKNGGQEGSTTSPEAQSAVISLLSQNLQNFELDTIISAPDDNNINSVVSSIAKYSPEAKAALGKINTHSYNGNMRSGLKTLAEQMGLPLWMSEVGCCFFGQGDSTAIWGAIWMADQVRLDIRDMGAQVWTLWQPDWNIVTWDSAGQITLQPQFYALSQYTNFIRPEADFKIISAGTAENTLAAYSRLLRRLVLVSTNWNPDNTNDFDLSNFENVPKQITTFKTSASQNMQMATLDTKDQHIIDATPVESVTTYVIDGLYPR